MKKGIDDILLYDNEVLVAGEQITTGVKEMVLFIVVKSDAGNDVCG